MKIIFGIFLSLGVSAFCGTQDEALQSQIARLSLQEERSSSWNPKNYYRLSQTEIHLEPDDFVFCSHGGKQEYITEWLQNEIVGYNLEKISGSFDPPGLGVQVTPLFLLKKDDLFPLVSNACMERADGYAHRLPAGFDLMSEELQTKISNQSPAVVYFLIQAQYLQKADRTHEAAIRDEVRDHILGWYVRSFYDFIEFDKHVKRSDHLKRVNSQKPVDFKLKWEISPQAKAINQAAEIINKKRPLVEALEKIEKNN